MQIKLDPTRLKFTSDLHFNHHNIIKYCNRPFQSVTEMNEALLQNLNSRVQPDDILVDLGDTSFDFSKIAELRSRIYCENIIKIMGNHDPKPQFWQQLDIQVYDYLEISVSKRLRLICFHYPIHSWNGMHRGTWHLHGHIHSLSLENHDKNLRRLDVGVDANNYLPWNFEEISQFMETRCVDIS